jgi:hypothetical protein
MENFIASGESTVLWNIFSSIVLLYCISRIFLHRFLASFIGEHTLYTESKYKEIIKLLVYSGISPWPNWDEEQRHSWESRWWIYCVIGVISSIVVIYTLYLSTIK